MILREYLDNLVFLLAESVVRFDPTATVVRFGSSIYGKTADVMDIDILVLSDEFYSQNGFTNQLIKLRRKLLEGNGVYNFNPCIPVFQSYLEAELTKLNISAVRIIPKFAFGPFLVDENQNSPTVYIHFKGVISNSQFQEFCTLFPFHALSIRYNHRVIKGTFSLLETPELTWDEFILWCNSLNSRVDLKKEKADNYKCLKKLLLTASIYKGEYSVKEKDLLKFSKENFNVQVDANQSLYEIREAFKKIYYQIIQT